MLHPRRSAPFRAGGRRGFVDVDAEEAALYLGLFGGDRVDQLLGDATRYATVDWRKRCAAFGNHAEIFQVLGGIGAAAYLIQDKVNGWLHIPDRSADHVLRRQVFLVAHVAESIQSLLCSGFDDTEALGKQHIGTAIY